jgi:hypothetical protein
MPRSYRYFHSTLVPNSFTRKRPSQHVLPLPFDNCTELQYSFMLKRPFQLPMLLLQFDGCPELLDKVEETELVYKI